MTENFKTLEFVSDAIYNGILVHKKGEIKKLDNSLGMADRWIKRGIALPKEEIKEEVVIAESNKKNKK